MKIYPLLIALLLAMVMTAAQALASGLNTAQLLHGPFTYPGLVLMVLGLVLIFLSAKLFRRHDTTLNPQGEPSVLATQGLYRYSRNPMYLGMLLGLIGLALFLGNGWQLGGPALFAGIASLQIRREEALLTRRFGDPYRAYLSRVRRWI